MGASNFNLKVTFKRQVRGAGWSLLLRSLNTAAVEFGVEIQQFSAMMVINHHFSLKGSLHDSRSKKKEKG